MVMGEPKPTLEGVDFSLSQLDQSSEVIAFKSAVLIYRTENLADVMAKYPDAYYIVSVRDPIKWLASFYDYRKSEIETYVKTKNSWLEPHLSLAKAGAILEKADFNKFALSDESFFDLYRAKGLFNNYIQEFEEKATADTRVLYLSLEQLKANSADTTRRLYEFLDLELTVQRQDEFIRIANPGNKTSINSMKQNTIGELKAYYADTYKFLDKRGLI